MEPDQASLAERVTLVIERPASRATPAKAIEAPHG
jgi:hypothetical protein